jgi:outer membrane lipoprotein carrier protein
MTALTGLLLQWSIVASAADGSILDSLHKVENRYNNVRTIQLDFEQTIFYSAQPSAKRTESGVLFLRKPGRMRWEYHTPSEKLFLSDGKDVYYYSSAANRVEKSKLKETEDMRAPLAFLIGRLDFQRDFKEYHIRKEGENRWVTAIPKSNKAPYAEVQFLLMSDYRIAQLRVLGQDQSVMEFRFRNEKLNPPISDSLFVFEPPMGAEFVEVTDGQN